jgi:uncharacterized protein YndB with AHSA1/START domain
MAAITTRTLFARETRVSVDIHASADCVWRLLTDAERLPSWTGTVRRIEGTIEAGGTIALVSSLDPSRTFRLRVRTFVPPRELAWGDAMGTRTYTIAPSGATTVSVTIVERIGGPLFPFFARMIPSFDASFDAFAADLKRAAESAQGQTP